ncbi:hypothetical protein BC936DRAFT_141838 [Jimgerdemannia flammicorona]|uniref:Uncharacterized protein n=1 Tax=Jimgerdemannia flammicorona TaxID=994334 RepID=A0A433DFN8_9FUNG|nr:hypothetical protein BC936DRAFT_141838 [Jimgerdemannia flammicorona]
MARWNFRKILKIAIPVAVGVVCLIAAPYVAPLLVTFLGFGAGGIVAGTAAASFMSSYGGAVAAGGVIAILQSIGALGSNSVPILCDLVWDLHRICAESTLYRTCIHNYVQALRYVPTYATNKN